MLRRCLIISSFLGIGAYPRTTRAQQQSDLVSWNWVSARFQPDSSRWAGEVAPNYVAYQNLSRTFLRVGLGRVSYTLPRQQLSAALVYVVGSADQQGTSHLAQLQLGQPLAKWALRPRWQLTLDRLWFTPRRYEGQLRPPTYRVRTLVGFVPQLSPHLSLVLNTEPFVYRTASWLQEVRSQAGLQFQPSAYLTVQALYWNWWAGYEPRRVRWQHIILLTSTIQLQEIRRHRPFVNRLLP